jgi:hypothetical protein
VVVGGRWWWGVVEKEAPKGRTNFANTWGMSHSHLQSCRSTRRAV